MATFQYHPDVLAEFPDIVGGVILARGLRNEPTPGDLRELYEAEQAKVRDSIGDTPLSELPSLAAWRSAFRGFGAEPTKHRSAAEALLRRLTKKGDIPGINMLVDIGNLVGIRYRLPVAVFDTKDIQGTVTVRFADGSERFTELGDEAVKHPEPGEVIFADETDMVIARRWCWRQSAESAANPATTGAIITVEAHHAGGRNDVRQAVSDLVNLLGRFAGGQNLIHSVLDAENPRVSDRPA